MFDFVIVFLMFIVAKECLRIVAVLGQFGGEVSWKW